MSHSHVAKVANTSVMQNDRIQGLPCEKSAGAGQAAVVAVGVKVCLKINSACSYNSQPHKIERWKVWVVGCLSATI